MCCCRTLGVGDDGGGGGADVAAAFAKTNMCPSYLDSGIQSALALMQIEGRERESDTDLQAMENNSILAY